MRRGWLLLGALAGCADSGPPDLEHGELYQTLRHHNGAVCSLAFSPDGSLLATAGLDGTVKIMDWKTQATKLSLPGHKDAVYPVAWTPDGARLLVGGAQAKVYQLSDGKELAALKGHSWVYSIAFGRIRRKTGTDRFVEMTVLVTAGGDDQRVQVWDASNFELLKQWRAHEGKIYAAAFDPTGVNLATASWDRTIKVYRTDTWDLVTHLRRHSASVFCLAFSPFRKFFVGGSENGEVKLFETGVPTEVESLRPHADAVVAAAFSRSGERFITASFDGRAFLYRCFEGRTYRLVREFRNQGGRFYSVAIAPDQSMVVAGSEDGTLRLWKVPSEERKGTR
jgi:WD40 repeat protein